MAQHDLSNNNELRIECLFFSLQVHTINNEENNKQNETAVNNKKKMKRVTNKNE